MDEKSKVLAKAVGEYLFSLRNEQRISQEEMAARLQITTRGLRKIEKGEVDASLYLLRSIVLELGGDMELFIHKVEKNVKIMTE